MGLFDKFSFNKEQTSFNYSPESEAEASFAILYAIAGVDGEVGDIEIDQILKSLMTKRRFYGREWEETFRRVLHAFSLLGSVDLIRQSVCKISDDFKETIFCIATEAILCDGNVDVGETKIIDFLSSELKIRNEIAEKVVEVFTIKYRDQVAVF